MLHKQLVYKIGKDSVKKTLLFFKNVKKNIKKKIFEKDIVKYAKYSQYCNQILWNKKFTILSFSPNFTMTEMRLCLMKHDWVNLQKLFSILLQLSNNKEMLIWRYALMIFLHSPISSTVHLEEFFNLCVGCQNHNYNYVLDQLVTLKSFK